MAVPAAAEASMKLVTAADAFEATAGGPRITAQLSTVRNGTDVVWVGLHDSLYGGAQISPAVTAAYSKALRLSWTAAAASAIKAKAAAAAAVAPTLMGNGASALSPLAHELPDSTAAAASATAVLAKRMASLKVPIHAQASAITAAAAVVRCASEAERAASGLRLCVQVSAVNTNGGGGIGFTRLYDSLHAPRVPVARAVSQMYSEAMRLSWDNPAPLRAAPPPTRTTSAAAAGTALNKSLLGVGTASLGTSAGRSPAPYTPSKVGGPTATHERRRLSFSMCTSASPASQAQTTPPPPALGSGTAVGGAHLGRTHGTPPPGVGAKRSRDGLAAPQLQQSPSGSVDRVSTASHGKQPQDPDVDDGVVCAGAASKPALAAPPMSSSIALLYPEDVARRLAAYAARGFPPSTLARFEAAVRQAAVEHDVTGMVLCCGDVEELAKVLTKYYKGGTSTGALCLARSFIQTECR